MTKFEKLTKDLEKAEITLENAKRRRKLLAEKIQVEEQKELQSLMSSAGVTASDIKELLAGNPPSSSPTNDNDTQGGYPIEAE